MVPIGYNNNMQLFQTSGYVVILNEMVYDARIVPLDGRPHLSQELRQWMGDARGHWEGDTLVVETTNFTDKTSSFGPNLSTALGTGETLNLTERFRRVDEATLLYEYTVTDPVTFTQPFTASISMTKSEGQLYEFACHEGNRGLANILSGARTEERCPPPETHHAEIALHPRTGCVRRSREGEYHLVVSERGRPRYPAGSPASDPHGTAAQNTIP